MKKGLTFALCAYQDNPYLEEAVLSLKKQTVPAEILLATSTPSDYIQTIASKHDVPYYVNPVHQGIAADWEFAFSKAETELVCIAHQDDVYLPHYAERVIQAAEKSPDSLLIFTDNADLTPDGEFLPHRFYLNVKRLLLWAYYLKHRHRSRLLKSTAFCFGNAICCPSVTYHAGRCGALSFDRTLPSNLDWKMWYDLAKKPGAFLYVPELLMAHRISPVMETAKLIAGDRRYQDDLRMLELIWGKIPARLLMSLYSMAYRYNANN